MPGFELFGEDERREVNEVLETGIMFRYNHDDVRNNVWKARDLETEVRNFTGAQYAHAVSSGSTAVACVMAAGGIGYGDEVICTPFTYLATIEAVMFAGALPVFAEVDETLCLSAEGIRKAITPRTKAVMLVHMCGAAANMDEIMAVCEEHNLVLLEDAGQALGATYKGTHVGLFGVAGAYSFDFFKITTAGEGGLFVTNSERAYKIADSFADHGHDHIGSNRGMEQHPLVGFNFRISELHAAVGLAQMRRINQVIELNRRNKKIVRDILSEIDGVSFRRMDDPDGDSATFLNYFLPNQKLAQSVFEQCAQDGVGGNNYWYINMYHFINQWDHIKGLKTPWKLPIHVLGAPQDYHNLELPKSQEVIGRLLSLGIRCSWTESEAEEFGHRLAGCIKKVL